MAKTIEEYKNDYAAAKAAGDAAGMQAANDGANALRAASGQTAQYATTDIQNTAAQNSAQNSGSTAQGSAYTPINATSAPGVNYDNYQAEVAKQQSYQAANPTAGQAYTSDEKQAKYGSITDPIYNTGVYTKDKDAAYAAAAQQGVSVTPTQYFNGEDGYYYVGDNKDQRTVQEGASGADEGLMTNQDYAIIQSLKQQYADAQKNYQAALAAGDTELAEQYKQAMEQAHLEAERIRAGYGYSGGSDGSMYITGGALRSSGSSGSGDTSGSGTSGSGSSGSGNTGSGTTSDLKSLLDQWKAAAEAQSNAQIDYAVQQAITELERALEDAQAEYKEQQESIYKDEMQSRDNAALYAEARGDKGGIGHDQYTSIMNTAAQNRLSVQQAQTKLATDTQRQIADLRAQGEFEKADKLLEISQTYLSNLISLEQWAAEYNLSVAQFQESVRQWEAEYELAISEFNESVRQYNTNLQYDKDSQTTSQLAALGEAMLSAGIMPSSDQLEALGMTSEQASQYLAAIQLQQAAGYSGSNSSKSSSSGSGAQDYDSLFADALASGNPQSYIANNYKNYGFTSSTGLYNDYKAWTEGDTGATPSMTLSAAKEMAEAGFWNDSVVAAFRNAGYSDEYLQSAYGYTPAAAAVKTANHYGSSYGEASSSVLTAVQSVIKKWSDKVTTESALYQYNSELWAAADSAAAKYSSGLTDEGVDALVDMVQKMIEVPPSLSSGKNATSILERGNSSNQLLTR